jgi:uncharacterized membrane protein
MMAAVFAAALALAAGLAVMLGAAGLGRAARVVLWTGLGIGAAAAWLIPSLSGGITELESGAVSRGFDVIAWADFLNPLLRLRSIETMYLGLGLLGGVLLSLFAPWARSRLAGALATVGIALGLLVTPQMTRLFSALPLSSLLWPVRFQGIAACFLLFAFAAGLKGWWRKSRALTLLLLSLVILDCGVSTRLIFQRPLNPDLAAVGAAMAARPGWREATLDESRLGSAASWIFSSLAGREQVFGWGYQGARTAHNVASLNDAITYGRGGYLADRLALYGVDDVVLLASLVRAENGANLESSLAAAGFANVEQAGEIAYYHRDGQPRALAVPWRALGIGTAAQTYAYLFPQVMLGNSPYLDDYTAAELARYPILILAGFRWHDQAAAEALAQAAAGNGARVIVDLTRAPVESFSQIPRFLDVWGESVTLANAPIQITTTEAAVDTLPFGAADELWHTLILQNLSGETAYFQYLGKHAVLAGTRQTGEVRVWFVGGNLAYHALLSADPAVEAFLGELTGLAVDAPADYSPVPLEDYQAGQEGYSFTYDLAQPADLLVPVAALDGSVLRLDGAAHAMDSVENLVRFTAPAGKHRVEIRYQPTRVYWIGAFVSVGCLLAMLLLGINHRPGAAV